MSTNQTRMPVLSALPVAYFVNGDTGLKQTTEVDWSNKYLNVEELAAIVPIPEAVLDDINFDAWGSIRPLLENAIGRTLDAAIFFGTNKPASWPTDIVTAPSAPATPSPAVQQRRRRRDRRRLLRPVRQGRGRRLRRQRRHRHTAYKGRLRQARATRPAKPARRPTARSNRGDLRVDVKYPMRGLWPTGGTGSRRGHRRRLHAGILGVRQDITYKILDQAVIQDNTGAIVFNLAAAGHGRPARRGPLRLAGREHHQLRPADRAGPDSPPAVEAPNTRLSQAHIDDVDEGSDAMSMQAPLVQTLRVQVDAAAVGVDFVAEFGEAPFDGTVTRVAYMPSGTITGANTNSRTYTVTNQGQPALARRTSPRWRWWLA
jgi:hypothetical protein